MDDKPAPRNEIGDELARKISQWRQANPNATLTEIEIVVEAELAQVRRQLVEAMVQEEAMAGQEVPACPQCGQGMVKNGRRKRKLQT